MDIIRDAVCETLLDLDECVIDYIYNYIVTGEKDWDFIRVFLSEMGIHDTDKIILKLVDIQDMHAKYNSNQTAQHIRVCSEPAIDKRKTEKCKIKDEITCNDTSMKQRILKDYDLRSVTDDVKDLPPVLDLVEYLQKRDKKSKKPTRFYDSQVVSEKDLRS